MKVYRSIKDGSFVKEEDAEIYALEHLGLTIKPTGKFATFSQDQIDFLGEFTEWYFSGNWYKEEIEEEEDI